MKRCSLIPVPVLTVRCTPVTGRACARSASEFIRVYSFWWTLIPRKRARQNWDVSAYARARCRALIRQGCGGVYPTPIAGFSGHSNLYIYIYILYYIIYIHRYFLLRRDFDTLPLTFDWFRGQWVRHLSVPSTTACGSLQRGRPHFLDGGLYLNIQGAAVAGRDWGTRRKKQKQIPPECLHLA